MTDRDLSDPNSCNLPQEAGVEGECSLARRYGVS